MVKSLRLLMKSGLFTLAFTACGVLHAGEDLRFRVLLDDKEIGQHNFRVVGHAGNQTIDIQAEFDVTFLAIPVYSYDHDNREVWKEGCLETIVSRTDDNGEAFLVDGEATGEVFSVVTRDQRRQLQSECVMTFAYWNREFLTQSNLLNAQTGEYLAVDIDFEGTEPLRLGESSIQAQRYRVRNRAKELDITVWYQASSGKWLSLESKVGRGKLLRYLPVDSGNYQASEGDRIASRL